MAEDRAKCLAVGCAAFESKPVIFDRLLATIERLLLQNTGAASQPAGNSAPA